MCDFENITFSVSEELLDLDNLAALISPDFSFPKNTPQENQFPATSLLTSQETQERERFPSTSTDSAVSVGSPYSHSPTPFSNGSVGTNFYPYDSQVFFPPHFSAEGSLPAYQPMGYPAANFSPMLGLQDYMQSGLGDSNTPQFNLTPVARADSSLKTRRRASRSKCPCIKCCNARANQIPSPSHHACMVAGCNKVYTRPAHLRSHLKSHENDENPKCEICYKTLMSAELFIAHMFEHGLEMKH